MERELKAKLDEAIKASVEWHCKPKTEPIGSKAEPIGSKKGRLSPVDRVVRAAIMKLRKQGAWTATQESLAHDAIAAIVQRQFDRRALPEDPAQIPLPGFEEFKKLPTRVGKQLFPEMTLKAVFAHRKRYEKKWDRDNQVMDELKKLTDYVRPIFEYDPSCRLAEAIAQTKKEFPARPVPKHEGNAAGVVH